MRIGLAVTAGAVVASAAPTARYAGLENLVVFGDSYSDNGRLSYYIQNKGKAPPPGVYQTVTNVTASGGLTWGQYVQQLVPGLKLVDYAISGATCSNAIVQRYFSAINRSFPAILDDEIPSFQADIVGPHTLFENRNANNTVYAMWIGTNDLGYTGFLSDSQAPGTNISLFVDCLWQVFDAVYAAGGRRFVLFNQAPLQLAPMYRPSAWGGAGNGPYWANKTSYNDTEYAYKIFEYTTDVNTMVAYGLPFQAIVRRRWPGSSVAVFNVHQLLTDMYNSPAAYLAAPANATGFYHHCSPQNTNCVNMAAPLDAFMWYDDLHPSSKTDSVIAQNFVDVVAGTSKYGTWYSS